MLSNNEQIVSKDKQGHPKYKKKHLIMNKQATQRIQFVEYFKITENIRIHEKI